MKNKILWVLFNITLSISILLLMFLTVLQIETGSSDWIYLIIPWILITVLLIMVVINFFVINIDWSKMISWWKELEDE